MDIPDFLKPENKAKISEVDAKMCQLINQYEKEIGRWLNYRTIHIYHKRMEPDVGRMPRKAYYNLGTLGRRIR